MTDRPIIFSAPMVRALLAGRKTQTRRLAISPLRRVQPGDRLYVRESFMPIPWTSDEHPHRWNISFAATGSGHDPVDAPSTYNPMLYNYERWTPSIHMPRWASRLTLMVTEVRVERLRAISERDAKAEGLECGCVGGLLPSYRGAPGLEWRLYSDDAFGDLWNALHTSEGERWQDDPEIVALTFRVERGNIDQIGRSAA